ncbi:MAG: TonB family protein [Deltaproteobacteria bacterium]|nr:MAG: TonB family protein [Deltaproteobacteria bacterium]
MASAIRALPPGFRSTLEPNDRRSIATAIAISLAAHALLLGAIAWSAAALSRPRIDLEKHAIAARLVRLGKERSPKLLPRKYKAPPPPKKSAVLPVKKPPAQKHRPAPKEKAEPAPKKEPVTSERNPDPLAAAIHRIAEEYDPKADPNEVPPGSPDGDPFGDASTGSAGDRYLALVTRAIRAHYRVPSVIGERERLFLNATVVLYVSPEGKILRHEIERSSGNPHFDAALLRAVEEANPLPPPPAGWRERFMREGLGVRFKL